MCGGRGWVGVESDRWTAMRYGRGAQIMVVLSVLVGRGVRVGVPRRAAGGTGLESGSGWHGRRYGYDVGLLGAAGSATAEISRAVVAIGVASASRCLGEEDREGWWWSCVVSQTAVSGGSKVQTNVGETDVAVCKKKR